MTQKKGLLDNFGSWVEKKLAPPLVKFGNQRHMAAMRASLIKIIPLIIVGSFPLIFTSLPFEALSNFFAPYADVLNALNSMTMGFMGLYWSVSYGAELAKSYKLEPIIVSIVCLASFLITASPINNGTLSTGSFGGGGMFTVIVVDTIVVEFMRFCDEKNIGIKMPEQVPENIAASFSALVPMAILFVFFWIISIVLGFNLTEALGYVINPLMSATDTPWAIIIFTILFTALWFVGIHGGSFTLWGPLLYPFCVAGVYENAAAHAAGQAMTRIFTEPFAFNWIIVGGCGFTLPLIAIYWNSKSVRLREIARVELAPGLFNINEPFVFGIPLVMNPTLVIPFVGISVFGGMYGYILTKIGLISTTFVQTPWSIPPLIGPYLSTGGDWRAVIAQAVLIVIAYFMWLPFAKVWEKKCIEEENGTAE